jgi:AraC family transcriptional regulator of adaptative response / DNA-3-methyladenine glycosylase II
MFGTPVSDGGSLTRLSPTPEQLEDAALERAGVMPARAEAIRSLARAVAERRLTLGPCIDGRATIAALSALPGIGDWTAEYIAMRALGEPDAAARRFVRVAGGLTAGRSTADRRRGGRGAPTRDAALAARGDDASGGHPRRHRQRGDDRIRVDDATRRGLRMTERADARI